VTTTAKCGRASRRLGSRLRPTTGRKASRRPDNCPTGRRQDEARHRSP
jgi:hypothetical protein